MPLILSGRMQVYEGNSNLGFRCILSYRSEKSGEFRMQIKNEVMKRKYDLPCMHTRVHLSLNTRGYFWYWSITVFLIFRVLTITSYTSNLTLLHWTIYFKLQHSSDRKVGQRVDSWQVYDWPPGHVPPLPCVLSSLIPYTRCCFLIMQIPLKHLWPKKRSTEWSS